MVGVLLPLAVLLAARVGRLEWRYTVQFFAGFCLIANGGYLGAGSFSRIGNASDPGVMLQLGSSIGLLWLFAAVTFPLGLYLWNGLGPHFGLAAAAGNVDRRVAYSSGVLLLVVIFLEATSSPR
jgi:hypothetical protein